MATDIRPNLEELQTFNALLIQISPDTMTLDQLDGFLVGLACVQQHDPWDYLNHIVGGEFSCCDPALRARLLEQLTLCWQRINYRLYDELPIYSAIMSGSRDEDGQPLLDPSDWASGFLQAVEVCPASWPVTESEHPVWHYLQPFRLLSGEHGIRMSALDPQAIGALTVQMLQTVKQFANHWRQNPPESLPNPTMH